MHRNHREESRWSLVLGLTRSYTQLLEKEISGQEKKKRSREKEERKIEKKKGRERRKEIEGRLLRKHQIRSDQSLSRVQLFATP